MYTRVYEKYPAQIVMKGMDEWLTERGLRQVDMANATGIATNTFSRWRSGVAPYITAPTLDTIVDKGRIPYWQLLKYIDTVDIALENCPKELVMVLQDPAIMAEIARYCNEKTDSQERKEAIVRAINDIHVIVDYSSITKRKYNAK